MFVGCEDVGHEEAEGVYLDGPRGVDGAAQFVE